MGHNRETCTSYKKQNIQRFILFKIKHRQQKSDKQLRKQFSQTRACYELFYKKIYAKPSIPVKLFRGGGGSVALITSIKDDL